LDKYKLYKDSLKTKATAGDPDAEFALGLLYEFPQDRSPSNRSGAAYWYKQASDAGNFRGTFRLGLYYLDQGSDTLAFKYLQSAAKAGITPAMTKLAEMIRDGNMFGNGRYYSQPWFEKAVAKGDAEAANDLGMQAWYAYLNPNIQGNSRTPVEWFTMAASGGNCEGKANLGGVYFNGVGVAQDAKRAAAAFEDAETCPGAPQWVINKAARFRQLIKDGRLPSPGPTSPVGYPQETKIDSHESQAAWIMGGALILLLASAALSGNSSGREVSGHGSNFSSDQFDDAMRNSAEQNRRIYEASAEEERRNAEEQNRAQEQERQRQIDNQHYCSNPIGIDCH
jgi:TPR repeat protein